MCLVGVFGFDGELFDVVVWLLSGLCESEEMLEV